VIKRNDSAKKDVELERLRMALRDNILTPEVKANGFGAVQGKRLEQSIEQIAQTYEFKDKAKAASAFDPSFLPAESERKAH
jgi:NitT/TauT family transport system substrate-binding protein